MFDTNPESWRRCNHCEGKLVRVTDQKQLEKHLGHHLRYAQGFHINEVIRIWLGWL